MISKEFQAQLTTHLFSLLPRDHTTGSTLETPATNDQARIRAEMVSAICCYLMKDWERLPEYSKRPIDFNFVAGSEAEEIALKQLARVFMEYAEIALKHALTSQRERLADK